MTVDQPQLFELPTPIPLRKPPKKPADGVVKYTKSTVKEKCTDCLLLILAHLQGEIGGPPPPAPLHAIYKRTQGSDISLLCAEHSQLRKAEEALQGRNLA